MFVDPEISRGWTPEVKGEIVDFQLFQEDEWMQNTEVKYLILRLKGRWHVWIVFFSTKHSMRIIVRNIDHYHSQQKAEVFAQIFQRGIRKDARGTQTRKKHAYHICTN